MNIVGFAKLEDQNYSIDAKLCDPEFRRLFLTILINDANYDIESILYDLKHIYTIKIVDIYDKKMFLRVHEVYTELMSMCILQMSNNVSVYVAKVNINDVLLVRSEVNDFISWIVFKIKSNPKDINSGSIFIDINEKNIDK